MQDFTGVPAIVDLAAMRDAMAALGGDPQRINPVIPVDLVIDHSVQVDLYASSRALAGNASLEFQRNRERYEFLRWGAGSFADFRVVPPATGIVHQVNLEYLASVVQVRQREGEKASVAFPDTLVGTDSHTPMINGIGVLGWGVGGIEAEAALLGQPLYMLIPEVVGMRLTGSLREGVTATDLVLTVTQALRKFGVVDKIVEFFGPGLGLAQRRGPCHHQQHVTRVRGDRGILPRGRRRPWSTCASPGAARSSWTSWSATAASRASSARRIHPEPEYSTILELDLASVESSLAGPKRPQDRIPLSARKGLLAAGRAAGRRRGGSCRSSPPAAVAPPKEIEVRIAGSRETLRDGAVVIAAITSCTNTSNPAVMIAAGLLARKAVKLGLRVPPYVKTSFAPGSKVVTQYLDQAGLSPYLEALGFHVVGYGCTTCIGNSGPLLPVISAAVKERDLTVVSVLSGQQELRGPDPSRGEGELPRLPSPRGGLRAGRVHGHRPGHRADRAGQEREPGVPEGHLADARGGRRGGPEEPDPRDVPLRLLERLHRRRGVAEGPRARGSALPVGRPVDVHPAAVVLRGNLGHAAGGPPRHRARACLRGSATRSPPTTSPRRATFPKRARPADG